MPKLPMSQMSVAKPCKVALDHAEQPVALPRVQLYEVQAGLIRYLLSHRRRVPSSALQPEAPPVDFHQQAGDRSKDAVSGRRIERTGPPAPVTRWQLRQHRPRPKQQCSCLMLSSQIRDPVPDTPANYCSTEVEPTIRDPSPKPQLLVTLSEPGGGRLASAPGERSSPGETDGPTPGAARRTARGYA